MYSRLLVGGFLALLAVNGASAQHLVWSRAENGDIPVGAFAGGREADGDELYICRARHNGGVHPGKIRSAFRGCNIGWGGKEVTVHEYEVLVGR